MEAKWVLVTAVAPVAWGANYVVTREWLPADAPLWGSALRALPAEVILMVAARSLPRGHWWWRSVVLAILNVAGFFVLVYLAAQLMPANVAASIMSLSPLTLAGFGWLLAAERPSARVLLGALAGISGVSLLLGGASGHIPTVGVLASVSALLMSSLGAVLGKRWRDQTSLLATTSWQLTIGGEALTLVATVAEGTPPRPNVQTLTALAFSSTIATALAFACWFAGLARLRTGTVGVIGLLKPRHGRRHGDVARSRDPDRLTDDRYRTGPRWHPDRHPASSRTAFHVALSLPNRRPQIATTFNHTEVGYIGPGPSSRQSRGRGS